MRRALLCVIGVVLGLAGIARVGGATTYQYDRLHRLTKVTYDSGTQIIYTYDASGNRTTKVVVRGGK